MTKAELVAYAEERGIEGVSSSMNKAEIIAVIEAAENPENIIDNPESDADDNLNSDTGETQDNNPDSEEVGE